MPEKAPKTGSSASKTLSSGRRASSPSAKPPDPLNVAVVGGGALCARVLKLSREGGSSALNMRISAVADGNPRAPGMLLAEELGIFTTSRWDELAAVEGLDLVLELSGSRETTEELFRTRPPGASILNRKAALAFLLPLMSSAPGPFPASPPDAPPLDERQQIQTILDSLPYRIMVVNLDMTIHVVNRTFLKEKGLTYDRVLGRHCYEVRYDLENPCGEEGKPCYLEEVKKHGKTLSTIHEYAEDNGEERFEVVTVSPILNDSGEIVQLVECSRDVTDRIRLEKEVQKSNTFLQNVIQSTVDGIVVVDPKGYILLFNEGMERLTGYTAKDIKEQGHLSYFYNMAVARENMRKMQSDEFGPRGKLNPTSMTIIAESGEEIPVTLSASIIAINGIEVGSVGVFTDMREILKMRKDLEEAHFQLVQSEKVASIGRMAAGVAHEINNPLSGILIYAELLREGLKENPQHAADVEEIIEQTLRCKKIVSELLEFSRQSIGKASSFTTEFLIDKCLNLMVNQASFQNIKVVKRFEPGMPEMIGDLGQLQQVFTNLFINAADAMEGNGTLQIDVRFDRETDHLIIAVSDTGPGIPPHHRNNVFDMFFTTKPIGRGTGLGLSITQNIVKLHGGRISFKCPPEGGTTFLIEIPLGRPAEKEEQPVFIGLDENE